MKYYLIFIFQLFYLFSNSQLYHPLIRNNTYWDELHGDGTQICNNNGGDRYFFEGDTIVQNHQYKILRSYPIISSYGSPFCPPYYVDTILSSFITLMREDTTSRQVYIYDQYQNNEFLLFDFSLSVGDTLISQYSSDSNTLTIDSISMITLNTGGLRQKFYLSNNHYYIENIGGSQGLFMPLFDGIGFWESLICVQENNINIYESQCLDFISLIKDINQNNMIIINPKYTTQSIDIKIEKEFIPGILKIYNQLGQIIINKKVNGSSVCIEKSKFNYGIYLIVYVNSNSTYYSKIIIE